MIVVLSLYLLRFILSVGCSIEGSSHGSHELDLISSHQGAWDSAETNLSHSTSPVPIDFFSADQGIIKPSESRVAVDLELKLGSLNSPRVSSGTSNIALLPNHPTSSNPTHIKQVNAAHPRSHVPLVFSSHPSISGSRVDQVMQLQPVDIGKMTASHKLPVVIVNAGSPFLRAAHRQVPPHNANIPFIDTERVFKGGQVPKSTVVPSLSESYSSGFKNYQLTPRPTELLFSPGSSSTHSREKEYRTQRLIRPSIVRASFHGVKNIDIPPHSPTFSPIAAPSISYPIGKETPTQYPTFPSVAVSLGKLKENEHSLFHRMKSRKSILTLQEKWAKRLRYEKFILRGPGSSNELQPVSSSNIQPSVMTSVENNPAQSSIAQPDRQLSSVPLLGLGPRPQPNNGQEDTNVAKMKLPASVVGSRIAASPSQPDTLEFMAINESRNRMDEPLVNNSVGKELSDQPHSSNWMQTQELNRDREKERLQEPETSPKRQTRITQSSESKSSSPRVSEDHIVPGDVQTWDSIPSEQEQKERMKRWLQDTNKRPQVTLQWLKEWMKANAQTSEPKD